MGIGVSLVFVHGLQMQPVGNGVTGVWITG